jgi:AcrR family transcriptional regulator
MAPVPYDERLEHLLREAARVFAEQGYHATSMRDLSKATGMSLAGMYYYVHCKDELLFRIQERCFTDVLQGARDAVQQGSDPGDRIERLIGHHVTFFAENMSEMKVLSHEAVSLTPERQAAIDRIKREYVDLLEHLIGDAQPSGSNVDERIAAYALFGMMNWIYTWYHPKGEIPPARLADQFASIFLNGIATETTSSISHGG